MSGSDNDQETKPQETKCKQRSRGKKRKRITSESSSDEDVLPENTLEVEKSLHASAIKNNLDDISVKKILKKVVTNDHVLAFVKLREEEEDSGTEESLRPKLTRAKAKELMKVSPKSAPWNLELTPIKHIPVKTRPEVKALIAQELPEDEDDEEYEPTNDEVPSDDDHIAESSSDVDSLPRTPATPRSLRKTTPQVVNDGPFKVPQQELTTPVRATIALRTRSKLSLSATSIEHIESSFVPPDDLPTPHVDSLWNDFLEDCLNPASNARNEDDDEADPEYNVAADPDAVEEDEESLENSIIKISKKELNDLVTELFSIVPDTAMEQLGDNIVQDVLTEHTTAQTEMATRWDGKKEPLSDEDNTTVTSQPAPICGKRERMSIGKCELQEGDDASANDQEVLCNSDIQQEPVQTSAPDVVTDPAVKPRLVRSATEQPSLLRTYAKKREPIRIEIRKGTCSVTAEQVLLLQQQLRQHVQLAAGIFLQLFAHPAHWSRAPKYKEYLVSLNQMVEKNPSSVVNVCNLKPALELVLSWEVSVSASTEENLKMVEFVQKELERTRKRMAQNAYHVGSFPELFMQVVANSTVFLYPYLLPAMPFRPDYSNRRTTYLHSEDELITLGLDQFWDYVVANPGIFKPPVKNHPRHRWGLGATLELICKYMMPWLPTKALQSHVRNVKRGTDKDNPIHQFFMTRQVKPVKHRLLPYNPQLSLYEQPEHEVPRIWIRYLAQTSHRFKKHLYNRHKALREVQPMGVDIDVGFEAPIKKPLPIDFTKKINCNRLNLLPTKPQVSLMNRIDVPINANPTIQQPLIVSDIFTLVSTSTGSFLVPLQMQTKTVDSTTTPICTPLQTDLNEKASESNGTADTVVSADTEEIEGTKTAEISVPPSLDSKNTIGNEKIEDSDHCTCCILINNICRRRKQTTIVDYFSSAGSLKTSEECQCKGKRYPRMTNRLRLLLKNYKLKSQCVFQDLETKISTLRKELCNQVDRESVISDDDENDLVIATLYQLKLTVTSTVIRSNIVKRYIHNLFSKFDMVSGDVCCLASRLFKVCEQEMMDLYKEFVGFLTAEQADKIGHFKHYFIHRCMENLIKKIEEGVPDIHKKCAILTFLKSKFFATTFQTWTACDICTALMVMMVDYPSLAQYVFSLFPHRSANSDKEHDTVVSENPSTNTEPVAEEPEATDNGPDDAFRPEDEVDTIGTLNALNDGKQYINEHEKTPMKIEEEEIDVVNVSKVTAMDIDDSTNDNDEDTVKTECPEWRRDEDKVILEVLQQHIAVKERDNETVLEILEETQVLEMISESLPHKSANDVKERILYLLELLLNSNH